MSSSSENNGASTISMAMGAVLKSFCGNRGMEDDDDEYEEGAERITERLTPLLASIIMHAFCRLEKEANRKILKSRSSSATKKNKNSHSGGDMGDAKEDEFRGDREVEMICTMVSDYLFLCRCVCALYVLVSSIIVASPCSLSLESDPRAIPLDTMEIKSLGTSCGGNRSNHHFI